MQLLRGWTSTKGGRSGYGPLERRSVTTVMLQLLDSSVLKSERCEIRSVEGGESDSGMTVGPYGRQIVGIDRSDVKTWLAASCEK